MKKFLSTAAAFLMFNSIANAAPMTLNVHDADLKSTIMLVARAGNLNVSVDDSVGGNISVSLSNVEPQKILEIIAKTKNLNLVQDGEIFIMTSQFSAGALMNSYLLPIKFGDAETLRKAVVMSLDPEPERDFDYMTRRRNSDGSYSYRYSYDEKEDSEGQRISNSSSSKKISRDERVLISPDVNALILYGTAAEYERAKNLLALLDVELKQVSLEARILAIDKNASKNLGIDWFWSALPQYPERNFETYRNGAGETLERTTYDRNFNDNTGYGILRFGRGPEGYPFEFYYGAKINALVTDGKAKILSRPNVTTIQGHEAVINVGNRVPVPKVSTNNTSTTTEIQYLDAGIILKYTPRVNDDGTITATIHTEVSTPQYVEDLKAYRFNTRSADTIVTVRDGEPMIIGGLIGTEEEKSVSKIPFLGDLPLLGALFRSHRKNKTESELLIFLTAHVLNGAGSGAPPNVKYSVNENTTLD
ncbi:MAG: type II secretion system protein GspD [Selenomonadaceae bacterium]|nr:type II secretion system protein GspD [Selenomonadaceae bacterium]